MRRATKTADADPPRVAWLRALRILEVVAGSAVPVALEQIARETGLPKPTAHRLVGEMVEEGVLLREARPKAFSIGHRATTLAISALTNSPWRAERHAILEALVDRIGETCNFTALDGTVVRYVDRVEADWPLRLVLTAGSVVPLHCTSSGKLFLSHMPARLKKRLIRAMPIKRYTSKTITDPAAMERECRRIKLQGYSTDDGGFLAGLISVAVPVIEREDRVIAAVAVHAPGARLPLEKALEQLPLLQQAAIDLGRLYGTVAGRNSTGIRSRPK
jgi:DNA-binding IclR family transcriptional regulator